MGPLRPGPRSPGPHGQWFRSRARGRGYDPVAVDRVWEVLAAFGAFGFCKAHAAAFAVPVYQSAWLKQHHPAAFYAGVLSHDPGMYPKRVIVQDARLSGVAVRPADVNASGADWTVTPGPTPGLRVALREVKGISDAELARITNAQPYASLRDFTERARVSRPVTERLVLVGAFDSLYANPGRPRPTRRDLLARVAVLDRSPAATLDDEAGLVDLAFFDQAQQRCADKLFASWLLLVRGRLRHAGPVGAGPGAYSVNAEDCWDLRDLEYLRATRGLAAVRAALRPASSLPSTPAHTCPTIFPNGFTLSPYAETGSPGTRPTYPSRHLWHPSPDTSEPVQTGIGARGPQAPPIGAGGSQAPMDDDGAGTGAS